MSKSKYLTSINYIKLPPIAIKCVLSVCKEGGNSDDLLEFRKQNGNMFSQLPILCKLVLPSRQAGYVYLVSAFVFAHLPSPQGALKHLFICTLNLCLLAQLCFNSSWDPIALGETETRLPECQ